MVTKEEFIKAEKQAAEQTDLIKEAGKVLQVNPATAQIGKRIEAGDWQGLITDIGVSAAVVGSAVAGPALGGAVSGAVGGGMAGGAAKTLLIMGALAPGLGIAREKIGRLWNAIFPDTNFKIQYLSELYKTEDPTETFTFEGKTYNNRDAAREELMQTLSDKGIKEKQRALYIDNLEEAASSIETKLRFAKDKTAEFPEFQERPGERPVPRAERFIREYEQKQERARRRMEDETLGAQKQLETDVANIKAQGSRLQFPGTPAQETEAALANPAFRELKRRQGVELPQNVSEAPVPTQRPLLPTLDPEAQAQRRADQAEQQRLALQAETERLPAPEQPPAPTLKNIKAQAEQGISFPSLPQLPGGQPIIGGVNAAIDETRRQQILEKMRRQRIAAGG